MMGRGGVGNLIVFYSRGTNRSRRKWDQLVTALHHRSCFKRRMRGKNGRKLENNNSTICWWLMHSTAWGYQSKRKPTPSLCCLSAKKCEQSINSGSRSWQKIYRGGKRVDKGDDAESEVSKFWGKSLLSLTFLSKRGMEEDLDASSSWLMGGLVIDWGEKSLQRKAFQLPFSTIKTNNLLLTVRSVSSLLLMKEQGTGALHSAADQSMVWLMTLILPGHCGSLLPALLLLPPPVYIEVSVR